MEHELDPYLGVINRFLGYHAHRAIRATQHDTSKAYPFIAMDTRQAFEQIAFVHDYLEMDESSTSLEKRFLDVGCGIGNILLIAEQYGFTVFGFEKDAYPCALARELVGEDLVEPGDAWEFQRYHEFDVVYLFRLLPEAATQSKLERMIEEQLKPGAVLIANRKLGKDIEQDKRFKKIHPTHPIWQKEQP
jgi:2-polyprenyl-3-methyl-5-hydroxy-6-metoxy-1,4-benzoquinol methylase